MSNLIFGNIRNPQRERILNAFGINTSSEASEKVEKSIREDISDEAFEVYDDVKKSDILNAISNYDNPIKMKKSGKEIKEQITSVILPTKRVALEEKKKLAEDLLSECGNAPKQCVPTWFTGDIKVNDIPFKYYEWGETYLPENNNSIVGSLSVYDQVDKAQRIKPNIPESIEQAIARQKYNESVRAYCEILTDITACEILNKNLKDSDMIDLTTRQIMAFGFDK